MATVRCERCGRVQTPRRLCVRCEALLPEPEVRVIEKTVERVMDQKVPCSQSSDGNVPRLADAERGLIYTALRVTNGDKRAAARVLGIGKTTLYRKLKRYEAEATVA